ncbi:MAG: DUF1294 domain-containing protein [Thermoplasmatales archaeon]|nr:DUF1294 domain-containing protein [Thermoplasmatales archaeon]
MDPLFWFLAVAYAAFNLLAYAAYASDKKRSIEGRYRIPERKLLGIAVPGAVGAAAAMSRHRHKTRKPLFKLVYVLAALHLSALACLAFYISMP